MSFPRRKLSGQALGGQSEARAAASGPLLKHFVER